MTPHEIQLLPGSNEVQSFAMVGPNQSKLSIWSYYKPYYFMLGIDIISIFLIIVRMCKNSLLLFVCVWQEGSITIEDLTPMIFLSFHSRFRRLFVDSNIILDKTLKPTTLRWIHHILWFESTEESWEYNLSYSSTPFHISERAGWPPMWRGCKKKKDSMFHLSTTILLDKTKNFRI